MSASIHQEIDIAARPKRIYEALTSSRHFGEFTGGAPTEISPEDGGAFSCFGGMITGRNIELKPDRRVVQAWRAGNWPEGVYSIVRFELMEHGSGTKLVFDQSGFPEGQREHLAAGWEKMYWQPLRKYLG